MYRGRIPKAIIDMDFCVFVIFLKKIKFFAIILPKIKKNSK